MAKKDWTGNGNSIYKTLGASNHTEEEREGNDYYATDPIAAKLLIENYNLSKDIYECSCGEGHLSKVFIDYGFNVRSTDLIDRGYGESGVDFLQQTKKFDGDIITNPPYSLSSEFIYKAMDIVEDGRSVCMFLKIQFLEGKKRKELFNKYPPKVIFVSSSRITCAKNGDFVKMKESGGSAVAYAWFCWQKGFTGDTIIKWIN
jgi:hypothetical protein